MSRFLRDDGSSIYDHFGPVSLKVDLDDFARLLEADNYGAVRFFAALIRVRRARMRDNPKWRSYCQTCHGGKDPIVEALEKLLAEGNF